MGAAYPDVAYGMEGDTPSWLGLIPNGLSDPERPDWGGWGGRYELYAPAGPVGDAKKYLGDVPVTTEPRPIWTNAIDDYTPPVAGEYGRATRPGDKSFKDFKATLWRWRDDFQNDFAARMMWTTKPYEEANHPPVPVLDVPKAMTVRSGERFQLRAHATDPDGDSVSLFWFDYPEAGSYKGTVKIRIRRKTCLPACGLSRRKSIKPRPFTSFWRATDKGTPPLTRYQRVIVTVTP